MIRRCPTVGRALVAAALAALAVASAAAADEQPAFVGNRARGQKIAKAVCNACHAPQAAMPEVPQLAGQYPEYLAKQLTAFR
ncbi:MAG: hypothetical protein JWO72_596, partial [Caulobacteraceae bacterium]|nr:hypothetical protein [Caulobacteraceae bacterium]